MGSLKLWIVMLALVSFMAGLASGLLTAPRILPPERSPGPFADYETLLVGHFQLSRERGELLHGFLDQYARSLEALEARHRSELEPEIARLGETYTEWIRNKILPEDRRDEFDKLSGGSGLHAAHSTETTSMSPGS